MQVIAPQAEQPQFSPSSGLPAAPTLFAFKPEVVQQ
jgi:hypothetical protein